MSKKFLACGMFIVLFFTANFFALSTVRKYILDGGSKKKIIGAR